MRYDFRCRNGHTFVLNRSMDSITTNHRELCPDCGMESERAYLVAPTQFNRLDWWNVVFDDDASSRKGKETNTWSRQK